MVLVVLGAVVVDVQNGHRRPEVGVPGGGKCMVSARLWSVSCRFRSRALTCVSSVGGGGWQALAASAGAEVVDHMKGSSTGVQCGGEAPAPAQSTKRVHERHQGATIR